MQFLSLVLLDTYTYEKEDLEASFEQKQSIAGPMTKSNSWNWLLWGRLGMLYTFFYSFAFSSIWKLAGCEETERDLRFSDKRSHCPQEHVCWCVSINSAVTLELSISKPNREISYCSGPAEAWPRHCKAAKPRELLWAPASKSHSSWLPCWERQGDSWVPNTLLQTLFVVQAQIHTWRGKKS